VKTPEKLKWLFGDSIDVKEAVVVVAAVIIILGVISG